MNFRNIQTVISREYTTRVKKKSFLVTTFLVPVLFAAFFVVLGLVMANMKGRELNVAVIDQSGIVMPYLESTDRLSYEEIKGQDPDSVKANLSGYGKDVLVVVSPIDEAARTVSVNTYSKDPLGVDFSVGLKDKVDEAVEDYRISLYNIEDLSAIMEDVKADTNVTEYTMDDSGNEQVTESGVYMMVSMILGIIIFMFIAMFGGQVMAGVIEEKSSRVVEVLISSVDAIDLMFGKIVGIALVALTQFLLWIVLTGALMGVAGGFMGDSLADLGSNKEMIEAMGANPDMMQAIGTASESAEMSEGSVIVNTLMNIPWAKLVISFFVFFCLGYLLYSTMFAAIGSMVENEGDSQQLQIPVTVPLMIAYFVILVAFQNPDSSVVVWCSMIPFTSPIVMLARIPYGVPDWQLIVSIVLLFLTFLAMAWATAKIYRAGILSFGKKATFKDMWKFFRQG